MEVSDTNFNNENGELRMAAANPLQMQHINLIAALVGDAEETWKSSNSNFNCS